MNNKIILTALLIMSTVTYAADNEIYVEQSGATANLDLEQLGSANLIGGLLSSAGSMTPLDLDGSTMTLDINQIGGSNSFLGDMWADNLTGYFNFDGSSNAFTIQVDPTNTYGANGSDLNVQTTGSSNTFTLDLATASMSSNTNLDWVINGDSNTINADIDYDGATNYMDIDGDSNTVNFDGQGYAGGYFYLDQTGNSRTFSIQQQSTLDNDWLKILSTGSGGSVCVIQGDQLTSVGC
jgi:hypothetical protein|tara:strand:- start:49 stop:762 length:714 start_codon:yes stop_codon:yes gene_type:complete